MDTPAKIERPDEKGNGCSLDCGVAFTHTHPTGERRNPVPCEDTPETMEEGIKNFVNGLAFQLRPSNDTMDAVRLIRKELPSFISLAISSHNKELVEKIEKSPFNQALKDEVIRIIKDSK